VNASVELTVWRSLAALTMDDDLNEIDLTICHVRLS